MIGIKIALQTADLGIIEHRNCSARLQYWMRTHDRTKPDRWPAISAPTRLRLQLVFAGPLKPWPKPIRQQAAEFVRRLKSRLTVDGSAPALLPGSRRSRRDRRDGTVPRHDLPGRADRERRLARIPGSGLDDAAAGPPGDALRRRVQYVEETNLECRLAASMAEDAVAATHVRMALETAEALADEVPPDQAIMHLRPRPST